MDWTSTMKQSYEFYIVDPGTWKDLRPLNVVTKCKINRDSSEDTLGSASITCTEVLDECYIRVYLIATQKLKNKNEETKKIPLGTFLVQTPSIEFDGKVSTITLDAYTPLIELKDVKPPIGYTLQKNEKIMENASKLCGENTRVPVVKTSSDDKIESDFISNLDDSWFSFINDLIYNAKYKFGLDELGKIIFEPIQDLDALQPVWTYTDNNTSILYPDISYERDLFEIPNAVEVVYSSSFGYRVAKAVNDSESSPISTVNRGREVLHRETNPRFTSVPTQDQLDEYAKKLLKQVSVLQHKLTYKHGYCPVRVGDCVLFNCRAAGLSNVKARVISQTISCETGCPVEETAVYTTKLWG